MNINRILLCSCILSFAACSATLQPKVSAIKIQAGAMHDNCMSKYKVSCIELTISNQSPRSLKIPSSSELRRIIVDGPYNWIEMKPRNSSADHWVRRYGYAGSYWPRDQITIAAGQSATVWALVPDWTTEDTERSLRIVVKDLRGRSYASSTFVTTE